MMDISAGWACPQCGAALEQSGQHLLCPEHGKSGRVEGGIACFVAEDRYWGEVPQAEMQEWCRRAEEAGWERMLSELAQAHPDLHLSASNRIRANWLHLYPGPVGGSALDLGAGWGAVSEGLTEYFGRVYAVDSAAERTRLLACRFRGREDHVRVGTAVCPDLPLAPASLQLVVMNGVLEWLAVGHPARDPMQAQVEALRRVGRLLQPGGWLYVGIENRFGFHLLQGSLDHSGRPYTSLMPRWWANRVCRGGEVAYRTDQAGYRTYTYTYWGYRRLLRQAGYGDLRLYAALPGYNRPEALVPLARVEPLDAYLAAFADRGRKTALARRVPGRRLRMALARLVVPHFAIFAQKGDR